MPRLTGRVVRESFPPIVGYKQHGAIVHLSVGENEALQLEPENKYYRKALEKVKKQTSAERAECTEN